MSLPDRPRRGPGGEASDAALAGEGTPPRPAGGLAVVLGLLAYPIMGPLLALVVIFIVFSVAPATFLNTGNVSLMVQQSVVVGTLALGQTLIILVSGIDLANGAI